MTRRLLTGYRELSGLGKEERARRIRSLLDGLPPENLSTLELFVRHLQVVAMNSGVNRMTLTNLAIALNLPVDVLLETERVAAQREIEANCVADNDSDIGVGIIRQVKPPKRLLEGEGMGFSGATDALAVEVHICEDPSLVGDMTL